MQLCSPKPRRRGSAWSNSAPTSSSPEQSPTPNAKSLEAIPSIRLQSVPVVQPAPPPREPPMRYLAVTAVLLLAPPLVAGDKAAPVEKGTVVFTPLGDQ